MVALLSIFAAMTMPTFFMNATDKIVDARIAMFKARYLSIRTAIDLHFKDEAVMNTDYHISDDRTGGATIIQRLVESGHLQANSTKFEKNTGEEVYFKVELTPTSTIENQLPPILRTMKLHVIAPKTTGGDYDIDQAIIIDRKTWRQIWGEIN